MKAASLIELVRYAWKYSDFYRKFWGQRGFDPEQDFREDDDLKKIPILTKNDLLSVSTVDRSALQAGNHYYFTAISSGTTLRPLISLQSHFAVPPYYRFIENLLEEARSSVIILRPASHAAAFIGATIPEKYFRYGSIISLGDINNLIFSAHIAREIGANRLVARPSDSIKFATVLEQQGYPPSRIKFLHITGEPITSSAISLLERLYPSAVILYAYAMTEGPAFMGLRSSKCNTLVSISPGAYHLSTQDFIFEEVDGLSVITALHKIPTPLIRYNTGDRIIIKKNFRCSCGFPEDTICAIGPRAGEQYYKIGGCTFRTEEIRFVLRKLPEFITDDFALQIEQVAEDDRLLNSLRFVVRPINGPATPLVIDIITKTLERELYVTRALSLGKAIQQSLIRPIEVGYDAALLGAHIFPPSDIMRPFRGRGE